MKHFEWHENAINERVPEAVLAEDGIENAKIVWVHYRLIPAILLEDERAFKQHVALTRIRLHDIAREECGNTGVPVPNGYKHLVQDPNEIEDMDYPPNIRLLWFFGWATKKDVVTYDNS